MKRWVALYSIVLVAVSGCGSAGTANSSLPTPAPGCGEDVCIQYAELSLPEEKVLQIEFFLTDLNGEVLSGDDPEFTGTTDVGLFRPETEGEDMYLVGMSLPPDQFMCYVGNDIPGKDGKLASVCSILVPATWMQERPAPGDTVRLEVPTHDFEQWLRFPAK